MSVHPVTIFYADCDECGWVSIEQEHEHQAETLLDKHIRNEH